MAVSGVCAAQGVLVPAFFTAQMITTEVVLHGLLLLRAQAVRRRFSFWLCVHNFATTLKDEWVTIGFTAHLAQCFVIIGALMRRLNALR